MRSIGTVFGGPPVVETFLAAEADISAGDVLLLVPGSGKVGIADGGALVTAGSEDKLDISDLTNGGEGFVAGLALNGSAAIDDVVRVAMAGPGQLFEANYQETIDGTTVVAHVSTQDDLGVPLGLVLMDAGGYIATDIEASETIAHVYRIGYGFVGENVESGHGVVGDTNVRVTFIFTPAVTLLGQ